MSVKLLYTIYPCSVLEDSRPDNVSWGLGERTLLGKM